MTNLKKYIPFIIPIVMAGLFIWQFTYTYRLSNLMKNQEKNVLLIANGLLKVGVLTVKDNQVILNPELK